MNPEHVRAVNLRNAVCGDGRVKPVPGVRLAEYFPQHAFAGAANQHLQTKGRKLPHPLKKLEVMVYRLAEPDSGVDMYFFRHDAGFRKKAG